MQFEELRLSAPILRAVRGAGYTETTPIQAQAIPPALDGSDILGCAQTGTGKTAAFSLPILEILAANRVKGRPIRSLIVTPTRELAAQIGESLETYGRHLPLYSTVIFGGVSQMRQVQALRRGVDILVATPGRLLDLIDQGYIFLDQVEVLVLDEADRMLDMGFINDIRKIVGLVPRDRQTLFFSATMPSEIRSLAGTMLYEPVEVSITPQATAAETVEQRVYLVDRRDKQSLLAHLLRGDEISKALVFTRTKHGADRVAKRLGRDHVEAVAIHGNKSQNARTRALDRFKRGHARVLVASDIAARGLDIDDVSHVINFDLPNEPETYVHRIGRTGRAGATGVALSFCADEELAYLRSIERIIKAEVPVIDDHPFHAEFEKLPMASPERRQANRGKSGSGRGGGRDEWRPGGRRRPRTRGPGGDGRRQGGAGDRQRSEARPGDGRRDGRPEGRRGGEGPGESRGGQRGDGAGEGPRRSTSRPSRARSRTRRRR